MIFFGEKINTMFSTPRRSFELKWNAARAANKLLLMLHTGLHTQVCRSAIIGGGLGGTSSAYYLRQLWGDKPLEVDIFESRRIGGRLALVNVDGQDYDVGGAALHGRNRYMAGFAQEFGLGKRKLAERNMGLYNSKEGLYFETSPSRAVTLAKMFARYGKDLQRVQTWVADNLSSFDRIYDHQKQGLAFTTVDNLIQSMDERFPKFTRITTRTMFEDAGFSDRFINEIIAGGLRRNCGQTTNVHGFVGCVTTAGVEPGLWAVKGGNRSVPEKLLEASGATLIPGEVTHVIRTTKADGKLLYKVQYQKNHVKPGEYETGIKDYDLIIIATPLNNGSKNQIQFEDFPGGLPIQNVPFHTSDMLLVHGRPSKSFFGKEKVEDIPAHIMTTDENVFFTKMGLQTPVSNEERVEYLPGYGVWKLYLNETPTDKQLRTLFDGRKDFCHMHWRAFPEYDPKAELPPFVLHDRLYYPNAVEAACSFMEMAVIGGRNVANLAHSQWFEHWDKIDTLTKPTVPSVIKLK